MTDGGPSFITRSMVALVGTNVLFTRGGDWSIVKTLVGQ
jgi:hypothetical protein